MIRKSRIISEEEFQKPTYAKPEKITMNYMGSEMNTTYEGLVERFARQHIKTEREKSEANQKKLERFTKVCECPGCQGKRYNEETLSSKINDYSIYDLTQMQIDDLVMALNKKSNIYLLDEPTTGFHMSDTKNILAIISEACQKR